MKFFFIVFCLLLVNKDVFCQTEVPDYVTETLKKYHRDKQPGVFYNFDDAKNNPNDVVQLKLVEAGLKFVPNEIRSFKNIEILDLGYNEITNLPVWLSELKKLRKLIINRNKLKRIPDDIFIIKSMEFLDLSNNEIENLDIPEIRTVNLKELDLSFNFLSDVPKSLSRLNTIEILRIHDNKLTTIPSAIFDMKSLKYLSLDDNHITDFDDAIKNAISLQTLILTRNAISKTKIKKLKLLLPKCKIIVSAFLN